MGDLNVKKTFLRFVTSGYRELVKQMLTLDFQQRPSALELLNSVEDMQVQNAQNKLNNRAKRWFDPETLFEERTNAVRLEQLKEKVDEPGIRRVRRAWRVAKYESRNFL